MPRVVRRDVHHPGSAAQPYQLPKPPEDLTEHEALLHQILGHVAFTEICAVAMRAVKLGANLQDPDVVRKVIAEGEQAYRHRERAQRLREVNDHERRHIPVVYYFSIGAVVKIGFSTNLRDRFDTFNPQRIHAFETGTYATEKKRHNQFAHLREHGEWFRLAPDLTEWMDHLADQWQQTTGATPEQWYDRIRHPLSRATEAKPAPTQQPVRPLFDERGMRYLAEQLQRRAAT